MELLHYLHTLRRHARLIIAVPLLFAALGFALTMLSSAQYDAEAQLLLWKTSVLFNLEPRIKAVSEADSNTGVDLNARRKSLTTIGKSPVLAKMVTNKLGNQLTDMERQPNVLANSIDVTIDGELLRVRVRNTDPNKAALIANTWAEVYRDQINDLFGEPVLSIDQLKVQVERARHSYADSEQQLITFISSTPLDALNLQLTQKKQKLNDLVVLDSKLEHLLSDAQALRSRLQSGAATSGLGDELANVLLEASAFSAQSTSSAPSSPALPLNLQLTLAEASNPADLPQSLDALIASLRERRKSFTPDVQNSLQQEVSQLQARVEQETDKKQTLTRERDQAQQAHIALSNKLVEQSVANQSRTSIVRIAVPAVPPSVPVPTNRSVNVTLFSVIGLLLALGGAFALDYVRQPISGEQPLEPTLTVPILGTIPSVHTHGNRNGSHSRAPLLYNNASLELGESFRLLRHNIAAHWQTSKVLLVTSALPAEGKSFVAAHLAASFATAGKRVALLDADLRQPSQNVIFGVPVSPGLSEQLSANSVSLNWAQLPSNELRLMPAGAAVADAGALLESRAFAQLIDQLRHDFDVIVLDTPAALRLADALATSIVADVVLLVAQDERTSSRDVLRVKQSFARERTLPVGVILNRSNTWGSNTWDSALAHRYNARATRNGTHMPEPIH